MKGTAGIAVAVALLALIPLLTSSNVVLNFMVVALLIALVGQGWNVLGGYGGQYSFGHAAFFGTGAYVTAILQVHYGVNAWLGLVIGIAAGALIGAVTGALSFRSGLKGSYFALVTLAFAEVLRIIASVAPITGAGLGQGILALNDVRGEFWTNVHNAYLNYGVDLGLVGFLVFVAMVVVAYRSARRIERLPASVVPVELQWLASGVRISLVGFIVAAFFHPVGYDFYFFYLAGLAVALKATAVRQCGVRVAA